MRRSNKTNKMHECHGDLELQEVELHHSVKKEGKIETLRNRSFGFTGDGSKLWKEGDILPFSVKWRKERKPTEKTVEHQTGTGLSGNSAKDGLHIWKLLKVLGEVKTVRKQTAVKDLRPIGK